MRNKLLGQKCFADFISDYDDIYKAFKTSQEHELVLMNELRELRVKLTTEIDRKTEKKGKRSEATRKVY